MKIDIKLDKSEVTLAIRQYVQALTVAKGYEVKTLKILEDGTVEVSLGERQYSGGSCGKD